MPGSGDGALVTASRVVATWRITVGDGRSTESLVEAGGYGYAHSCLTSDNFPVAAASGPRARDIVLIEFDAAVATGDVLVEAARLGLARPTYEDALHFGAAHPDVQREKPVAFLHEPWVGFFGRRDVLSLWTNGPRRELGLEGFDDRWAPEWRFAFVRPG
jgi:hypothetical protein